MRSQLCVRGFHLPSMPQGMGIWLASALVRSATEKTTARAISGIIESFCIVFLLSGALVFLWLRSISLNWLSPAAARFSRRENFLQAAG
jgi:hypothetical protein